jgi:hypothetical protein
MLGEFSLEHIEHIESSERRVLVEHAVPGLAGNYFQDMGTAANIVVIVGTKHGDDARDAFLEGIREIFNAGEPTTFVADINTATDITEVIIEDLKVAEISGDPDSFRYLIKLRKYIEPPEPPVLGGLDASVLSDALGALDAMDLLDALVTIPDFADPTEPLKEAMNGIKNATAGLADAAAPLNRIFGIE